jgi:hypothetical protein
LGRPRPWQPPEPQPTARQALRTSPLAAQRRAARRRSRGGAPWAEAQTARRRSRYSLPPRAFRRRRSLTPRDPLPCRPSREGRLRSRSRARRHPRLPTEPARRPSEACRWHRVRSLRRQGGRTTLAHTPTQHPASVGREAEAPVPPSPARTPARTRTSRQQQHEQALDSPRRQVYTNTKL